MDFKKTRLFCSFVTYVRRQPRELTMSAVSTLSFPPMPIDRLVCPSEGELLRIVFVAVSPGEVSPYIVRSVCKDWLRIYDTGTTWKMLFVRHLLRDGEALPTAARARRECNLRLQAPFQDLIKGAALQEFRESGSLTLRGNWHALPDEGPIFSFCLRWSVRDSPGSRSR